jgi:signal peptidase I
MVRKTHTSDSWTQIRDFILLVLLAGVIRTIGFGLYQVPTGSMETTMLVGERFFADKFTILFSKPKRGDIITFNDPTYNYSSNTFMNFFQRYVWGPSSWTKRVIGVPGDHLKGVIEEGKPLIYVNGKKLDEPYLNRYPLIPVNLTTMRSYDVNLSLGEQKFYKMDSFEVKRAQRFRERIGLPTIREPQTPLMEGEGSDVFELTLGSNEYWAMGDNRLGSSDSRKWGVLDGKLIHGKIIWRIFSVDSDEAWQILDLIKHPISFWSKVRWDRCFQPVI